MALPFVCSAAGVHRRLVPFLADRLNGVMINDEFIPLHVASKKTHNRYAKLYEEAQELPRELTAAVGLELHGSPRGRKPSTDPRVPLWTPQYAAIQGQLTQGLATSAGLQDKAQAGLVMAGAIDAVLDSLERLALDMSAPYQQTASAIDIARATWVEPKAPILPRSGPAVEPHTVGLPSTTTRMQAERQRVKEMARRGDLQGLCRLRAAHAEVLVDMYAGCMASGVLADPLKEAASLRVPGGDHAQGAKAFVESVDAYMVPAIEARIGPGAQALTDQYLELRDAWLGAGAQGRVMSAACGGEAGDEHMAECIKPLIVRLAVIAAHLAEHRQVWMAWRDLNSWRAVDDLMKHLQEKRAAQGVQ